MSDGDVVVEAPAPEAAPAPAPEAQAAPVPQAPRGDDRRADIKAVAERLAQAPAANDGVVDDRPRGPDGKFIPKDKPAEVSTTALGAKPDPALKPASTPTGAPAAGAAPPAPPAELVKLNPPANWKPVAREKWAALPREVQEEAVRVHNEVRKVMDESAQDRRVASGFREALAPYAEVLRGSGPDPIRAVASIVQTVHALQSAPEHVAASMLARIVQGYGTQRFGPAFIEKLAAAIDGAPMAQAQAPIDVDGAVAKALEAREKQREQAELARKVEAFKATAPEFLADVQEKMAGLLQGGLAQDLESAYKMACSLDPNVSAAIKQREASDAAKAQAASTQRSRTAAVSLKPQPAGPVRPQAVGGDDIRGALKRAAERAR